jgi:peptide/nickel transport system permease protein
VVRDVSTVINDEDLDSGPPPGLARRAHSHPVAGYVLRRALVGLALVIVVSALVFIGTQVLPGNAAIAILGRQATPASVHALSQQLGLNHPAVVQYLYWIKGLLTGHLGTSYSAQEPVSTFIGSRVVNTLVLAIVTMIICVPLSLALGTWAAFRSGRLADRAISYGTLGAIALPEFVTGQVLILAIALRLKLLPPVSLVAPGTNPLTEPTLLVLPVLTLLLSLLAYSVRMVRAGVLEVLSSDYVRAAVLNGSSRWRILLRYVMPNAIGPSIQVFALTAQWLVGGIVIVETVFQYPGLGQGLVLAVSSRDIPVVEAVTILIAAVYISINIVADILVMLVTPKLRTRGAGA